MSSTTQSESETREREELLKKIHESRAQTTKADRNNIYLPTTEKEFDDLVDQVMAAYPKITDKEVAAAVISVAIRHLPNDQATSTLQYFGHTVLKAMANHVANFKSEKAKHEVQVEHYFNLLKSDPNDNQARDQLEKWANEGSNAAKGALAKLEPKKDTDTEPKSNIFPIETA